MVLYTEHVAFHSSQPFGIDLIRSVQLEINGDDWKVDSIFRNTKRTTLSLAMQVQVAIDSFSAVPTEAWQIEEAFCSIEFHFPSCVLAELRSPVNRLTRAESVFPDERVRQTRLHMNKQARPHR